MKKSLHVERFRVRPGHRFALTRHSPKWKAYMAAYREALDALNLELTKPSAGRKRERAQARRDLSK